MTQRIFVYDQTTPGWSEQDHYPWTVVRITGDFTTTNDTDTAITGLAFTPAVSTRYLIQIYLLLMTGDTAVGPRPGISWPTGMDANGAVMHGPLSSTNVAQRIWGGSATQNAPSTGLPDATNAYLARGEAYLVAGSGVSGAFQMTLASETAGSSVSAKSGSFLMYREIP
jgi:hypothetical protein